MRLGTVTDHFAASKADYEGGDYSPCARLFDSLGPDLKLEQVRAIEAPGVMHLKYRVVH